MKIGFSALSFSCVLLLLLAFPLRPLQAQSWKKEIRHFQNHLNEHYSNAETSPLTEEDQVHFKKHAFYKKDKSFRVAAQIRRSPEAEPFIMATVSGKEKKFQKYADLDFEINGKSHRLEVYQGFNKKTGEFRKELFLPFRDLSSGKQSYGGGRYIDLPLPSAEDQVLLLDFNQAYNPYCAYSSGWNCPIPPLVNFVEASIWAGVKAWSKGH